MTTLCHVGLDLPTLRRTYADGLRPRELLAELRQRIRNNKFRNAWITLADDDSLAARLAVLEGGPADLPLYGVPFGVKDNIDVRGLPTTAACSGYARMPERSATAVERLESTGAICIGKTNLDQFATGLSGVRSPYGACSSVFHADYVSGGSSSGSAVAVAAGLVSLALGTDTGGSGRIPAGWNNVVGLKPTRGVIPATGLVPNCRTLDCVSVFGLTIRDAHDAYAVLAGPDGRDPYHRGGRPELGIPRSPASFRFGMLAGPEAGIADAPSAALYEQALARLTDLGGIAVPVDFAPFAEAGAMMFDGPWVAERFAGLRDFISNAPDALLPVTRDIIRGGATRWSAVDAFTAQYRLQEIRAALEVVWMGMDVLVVPTASRPFTHAELREDPIGANNAIGRYSYFVNLLDLAALAIPNGFHPSGVASGVTLIGPALSDARLAAIGSAFERELGLQPGLGGR